MTSDLAIVGPQGISTLRQPSIPDMAKIQSIQEICRVAAASGLVQSNAPTMGQKLADAFVVAMYGFELGIPPITALQQIYVINGRPSCSAQLMLSLVRRAGFDVEMPDPSTIIDRATVGIRRPGGKMKYYTYTVEMAKQARLFGKKGDMWEKYTREMLMWRAAATACRAEGGDVIGTLYTVEELNPDIEIGADGAPLELIGISSPDVTPEPQSQPTKSDPLLHSRKRDNDSPLGEQSDKKATTKEDPDPHFLMTQAGKDRLKALLSELSAKTGRPGAEIIVSCTKAMDISNFSDAKDENGKPLTESALFARIREIVQPSPAIALDNPALVGHVCYITRNKQSFLAFLPQPWHPELEIRQYGRTTNFKKMVGDAYYAGNGFDAMEQNAEQPYDIEPLLIEWEMKGPETAQYMVVKSVRIVTDEEQPADVTDETPKEPSELDKWFASDGTQTPSKQSER